MKKLVLFSGMFLVFVTLVVIIIKRDDIWNPSVILEKQWDENYSWPENAENSALLIKSIMSEDTVSIRRLCSFYWFEDKNKKFSINTVVIVESQDGKKYESLADVALRFKKKLMLDYIISKGGEFFCSHLKTNSQLFVGYDFLVKYFNKTKYKKTLWVEDTIDVDMLSQKDFENLVRIVPYLINNSVSHLSYFKYFKNPERTKSLLDAGIYLKGDDLKKFKSAEAIKVFIDKLYVNGEKLPNSWFDGFNPDFVDMAIRDTTGILTKKETLFKIEKTLCSWGPHFEFGYPITHDGGNHFHSAKEYKKLLELFPDLINNHYLINYASNIFEGNNFSFDEIFFKSGLFSALENLKISDKQEYDIFGSNRYIDEALRIYCTGGGYERFKVLNKYGIKLSNRNYEEQDVVDFIIEGYDLNKMRNLGIKLNFPLILFEIDDVSKLKTLIGFPEIKSLIDYKNKNGVTALYCAVAQGNLEKSLFLVKNGANPILNGSEITLIKNQTSPKIMDYYLAKNK